MDPECTCRHLGLVSTRGDHAMLCDADGTAIFRCLPHNVIMSSRSHIPPAMSQLLSGSDHQVVRIVRRGQMHDICNGHPGMP